MAVGPDVRPDPAPVGGVRLGAAAAGLRHPDRLDLAALLLAPGSRTAAVFTRNRLQAAPVHLARQHLARMSPRVLLVNSGIANVATGEGGMETARASCRAAAELAGVAAEEVVPFSTGVIGEPLPLGNLESGLPSCLDDPRADPEAWWQAADAIRTTDTRPKAATRTLDLNGERVAVTGIAKGSGMIHPDMATMLAFAATDAPVADEPLRALLRAGVEESFHRISVDGDTSTNDAVTLSATGTTGIPAIESVTDPRFRALGEAVTGVLRDLARAIVADGEGATRLLTIRVNEAESTEEADRVADAIACSPLVKTAAFAGDPNWGRILAAAGSALTGEVDWSRVDLDLGEVRVVSGGSADPAYTEKAGAEVMAREEVPATLNLGRGAGASWMWTCDLSYEYVTINAEYRS